MRGIKTIIESALSQSRLGREGSARLTYLDNSSSDYIGRAMTASEPGRCCYVKVSPARVASVALAIELLDDMLREVLFAFAPTTWPRTVPSGGECYLTVRECAGDEIEFLLHVRRKTSI